MAINSPPEFDEWTISGLMKAPSVGGTEALRVKESAFSMECESAKLFQATDITHHVSGKLTMTMILVHVKYIHCVRNDVLNEHGVVDITKTSWSRDISSGRPSGVFWLPRSAGAEEKEKIEQALEARERRENQ
ncbi:hypothetical protein EDD16DRAFT_1897807 [Pisolithus croceorrhizus]|nr:hypothetical protein EDD16DRAFT_1897807 [Pisolithus croceorrhizus]KAI6120067.1 hypothetical protein EV401DRAFT_1454403 [Pisolithus croceorrhizus]